MLFVLYVLCCSAAFGTATYYVVQRTALFQRTLAAILRKTLRRLLYTTSANGEGLDLVYTDQGTTDLAASKLEKLDFASASSKHLEHVLTCRVKIAECCSLHTVSWPN